MSLEATYESMLQGMLSPSTIHPKKIGSKTQNISIKKASVRIQEVVASSARKSLEWLCEKGFIGWNSGAMSYASMPLGKATSAGSLKPQQALIVKKVSKHSLVCHPTCSACLATTVWSVSFCAAPA